MKTKNKVKNHFIRYKPLYVAIFLEIIIVLTFIQLWCNARPVSEGDLLNTTIVVDDVRYVSGTKTSRLYVFTESQKYYFPNLGKISNSKLSDMINIGDELFITYYTKDGLFTTTNRIVDAYSQTQVLRTTEEYLSSYKGVRVIETVVFILVELLFFTVAGFYLYIFNIIKIKKRRPRKQNKTEVR